MAIPNLFKQNKPRGFNYAPRYYDPKKEEREARRSASGEQGAPGREQAAESIPYRSRIVRGSMRNYFPRKKEQEERHNMIRLVVIILILIIITYFFLRF